MLVRVITVGLFKKGHRKDIMESDLYQGLFLRHPDGVFSLDLFDSIQESNEQFAQRLGYRAVELSHSSFSAMVHLNDIKRYLAFLKRAINGEAQDMHISLLHKNGQQVLTNLTVIPILNKEKVTGVYGIAKDVQSSSADLITGTHVYTKDSMDHAQQIGNFGFWEYDVHQKEFNCSDSMLRAIFGLDSTDGLKIPYHLFLSCIHGDNRDKVKFHLDQGISKGNPYEHEYQIHTKMGQRYIRSQGNAVKNEIGTIVKLIGTVHDLTDQKQVEKEKKEMEQRYKSLFTQNSDATYLVDVQGKHLDINEAAVQLLGYSKEEVLHQDFKHLVHPKDHQRAFEHLGEVLNGTARTLEYTLLHKNGREIIVNSTSVPVIVDDEVLGMIGITKNITEQKQAQRRLEESEERYRSLYLYNPDAVYSFDLNGKFLDCNPALEQLFGYSAQELVEGSFIPLVHQDHLEKTCHHFQLASEGKPQNYNVVGIHKQGHLIDLNITNIPITVDGQIVGVYGIAKDITEKEKAFEALKLAEEKYRTLIDESIAGVFIIQDGHIVYTNPRNNELLCASDSLIGRSPWDFVFPEDVSKLKEFQEQGTDSEPQSLPGGCRLIREDGKVIEVEFHISPVQYQGKNAVIGTVLDVTEQKKVMDFHAFLAHHDPLTNLPNRRMFEQKVDQSIIIARTCNEKLALMYLDLDRFKYINDTLGHDIGDQLLQCVAQRIKKSVRERDIVARIGGDEFTILLPTVANIDQAVEIAERVRLDLERPFEIGEYELFITSSVGISLYPHDGDDIKTLIKNADTALYRAKEHGKNNHQVYSSSMNIQTYKSFSLEKDLRKAIQHGELELYYQPRVDAISGKILSGEALVRWNHPDWGLVSPDEFISLAEESGLIIPLGDWVQERACRQNKIWQQAGQPLIPISINMSPQRFLQKDMIKQLESVLSSTGLDPKWLEIEITENALLHNEDIVIHTLNHLKELGIKIAMDDFGTGYSSLAYLKRFSMDTLKIDKSFIQGITEDVKDAKITAASTHLAKSLGITVVAEGVESMEQLHFLQKIKCDQIQGYLFSKPVPVDVFSKLLRKGKLHVNTPNGKPNTKLENQRRYFRLQLFFPLSAQMTIVQIKGRHIDLGETEVLIEDLGLGGMRFLATIKLAIHRDIILEFNTEILNKMVNLQGVVVWTKELQDGIYQYGVEFAMVEGERSTLAQVLNDFALQLRKSPLVPNCKLIKIDRFNYLKALREGKIPSE
jgi:diguanylate cyclase (GGDEF)-like protein/PAS domain S-box-containing protein